MNKGLSDTLNLFLDRLVHEGSYIGNIGGYPPGMKLHEMGPKAILHPKNVTFYVNQLDKLGLLEFVDETPRGSNKFYFVGRWKPTLQAVNGTRIILD